MKLKFDILCGDLGEQHCTVYVLQSDDEVTMFKIGWGGAGRTAAMEKGCNSHNTRSDAERNFRDVSHERHPIVKTVNGDIKCRDSQNSTRMRSRRQRCPCPLGTATVEEEIGTKHLY